MPTRIRLDLWRTSFLAGLGLAAFACGGAAESSDSSDSHAPECHPSTSPRTDGLILCEEGYNHREAAVACQAPETASAPAPGPINDPCLSNSDCVARPYGRCVVEQTPVGPSNSCVYECVTDSDCGTNQICSCGDTNVCIFAACSTDGDCEPGYFCTTEAAPCGGVSMHCQTPRDTCLTTADCQAGTACITTGDHRECGPLACSIGRPFLVNAAMRMAPLLPRDDWREPGVMGPSADELSDLERARLAAYYGRAAQLEHASIAAFARFALQLLSLGAPPQLVQEATQAMADETAHAQLCFELASRYAGAALGPGPLAIDGALTQASLLEVVRLVIEEGCIGETVAALEAAEAAAHASDPTIRTAMLRISSDERRHADLAWRFLRWALAEDDSLRDQVETTFAELLASADAAHDSTTPSASELRLLAHGLLTADMARALRSSALTEVIAPCARAILGVTRQRAA